MHGAGCLEPKTNVSESLKKHGIVIEDNTQDWGKAAVSTAINKYKLKSEQGNDGTVFAFS